MASVSRDLSNVKLSTNELDEELLCRRARRKPSLYFFSVGRK